MPVAPVHAESEASLLRLANARWNDLWACRPDLRPALQVQRRVLPLVIELADRLNGRPLPGLSLPSRYLTAKLSRGVPVLADEPIPVPVPLLVPYLIRLASEIASGGAGPAAERIVVAVREGRLDAAVVLTASLARSADHVRAEAVRHELAPDLLWLVAELTTCPFGHALQRMIVGREHDETLARGLDGWSHGYCLVCGSWPALAEAATGRRLLRCSFCALAWEVPSDVCPYCGARDGSFGRAATAAAPGGPHLEHCSACRGYLKIIDVAAPSPFPLLAIADLETTDLDMSATARGYSRPALRAGYRSP